MKITHENFQEKLKSLGAEEIRTVWVYGEKAKVKRTWGDFTRTKPGMPAVTVRAQYQQDHVQGIIITNLTGNIWLPTTADLETVIEMFEKVKQLKNFVGDGS